GKKYEHGSVPATAYAPRHGRAREEEDQAHPHAVEVEERAPGLGGEDRALAYLVVVLGRAGEAVRTRVGGDASGGVALDLGLEPRHRRAGRLTERQHHDGDEHDG